MKLMFLTASNGRFLGPIAKGLGYLMNLIYIFQSEVLHINNVALTIVLFTIFVYICLYPLTYRQQKFSVLSQKMNPEIKAIQKKYKGKTDQNSRMAMQEETQSVYDKYGVSPVGSCIQAAIQMPILFALYRVFFNIPGYIFSIKGIFSNLVDGILKTDNYPHILDNLYKINKISGLKVNFTGKGNLVEKNYIIDFLYKLSDKGWENLSSNKFFPDLSSTIEKTRQNLHSVNYLFGINISDTPWNLIKISIKNHAFLMVLLVFLLPIFSYLSQVWNMRVSQVTNAANADDPMMKQMKMMNVLMPFMSFIFAFSVPVGLVIYWIMGAVVRTLQMYYLNNKFKNIDLDAIIEKNKEKAAKKKEKRGIRRAQIYNAANINTKKTMSSKANINNKDNSKNSFEYKETNFKKGSLASKANIVNEFNHKNSKK